MAIKCIALDLDGTTLDKDGKLPEENRKEIEEAIAQGIEIVIASGEPMTPCPRKSWTSRASAGHHQQWRCRLPPASRRGGLPFYPAVGGGQGAVGLHGRGKRQL